MPTPAEQELWQAIKDKQFNKIIPIVKKYPSEDLINSVDSFGDSLAMIVFYMGYPEVRSQENITFILTNPQLNVLYRDPMFNKSLADRILECDDSSLIAIELLKDNSAFLCGSDQLAYKVAKEVLDYTQESYEEAQEAEEPDPSEIEELRQSLEHRKKVIAMVRDVTLIHAISTNNTALLDRMETAGGEPQKTLGEYGNHQHPTAFLNKDQENAIKITQWYKEKQEPEKVSLGNNPFILMNLLGELRAQEEAVRQAEIDAEREKLDVVNKIGKGIKDMAQSFMRKHRI